ncbi:Stk1 family PASTA domain-containing Ser/Thr kinase [Phycicoccus sp. M110.8]|uniref:Stk1 family PASTA domain-containing Ser/Thr kinase n=1 Tax=Phycicoccus sp. M110.8 TaxID=3075433 RepID=UPI0028FD756F|nr:Stk1 family PASTA domain-containing Ser/Thr kinase [Phycicoccus sp. M110.8]MDU0315169.1 Stk1 family PASTA domain-containing Ser/Thr kinase [Phycicoccus sp. M110.8]
MSSGVTESLLGRVLDGRYRVQSHIADGGMASVYLALDTRLDRDVALKVLRADLAQDEAFVTRFRREARSAARLSHPNVVAVFDQGEDDGLMFLAMEYVPGQTLREVMRAEGPLTPRAALDILAPVLQALGAAHRAGIIHRDVKPENVILREDDGTVKVADFGLARAVSAHTVTSQTGVLLGTVAYLSPEQVERGIADARSDVYAAGLILFEMLTGTKAFTGDTPIHIAYQHVHGSIPAPSSRVPSVPQELDSLVALATSRDPDQRPSDAADFLTQVRASRAMLTPAELDRRPEGPASLAGGASTVAVERTSALPVGADGAESTEQVDDGAAPARRRVPPVALPIDHTPTVPPGAELAPRRRGALEGRVVGDDGRRGGLPWRWIAIALAVLVVAGLSLWWFLAGPGSPTVVPRTTNLAYAKAATALERAHLTPKREDQFDESVPKGVVMSTDPGAGTEVSRGTDVTVTVSRGPERYAVPDVAGKSKAEATDQIAAAKLAVGSTTEAFSETVAPGLVISVDPKAGTELKRGADVALVVSKGRQPIAVTDWTGKPADQAVNDLTGKGLQVDATQQEFSTDVAKGSVISQTPAGGTLYRGDSVKLVVSKGPEMVPVPDVQGKQEAEAEKILTDAGFKVQKDRFMGGVFGTVRSQSPAGGGKAPKGSVVTLVIV